MTRAISFLCSFRQFRTFFGYDFVGALFRFVEQIAKLHRLARARLERLAVVAHDFAEADVNEFRAFRRVRFPAREDEEQLFEMPGLAVVHDINDFIRRPRFEPVINCRQVGGGVVETAVTLADERGIGDPLAIAVDEKWIFLRRQRAIAEYADRAFAFARNFFCEQIVHDFAEPRIVKTFAKRFVKFDAEPRINFVELLLRQRDHLFPDGDIFGFAAL